MNIVKNTIISKKILLGHKTRTALSLSGIVIGIVAVVVMVSIGKGTEEKIIGQINSMGKNLLVVNAGQLKIVAGRARRTKLVTTLELKDAESILARSADINYAAPVQRKKCR